MAVTLGITNTNLLGPSNWAAGSGGVAAANGYGAFNANQSTATENNRYLGTDPWGNSALVWQTVPSGDGNADGGWNTDTISITNTKMYRFSVWVRRTSSTGGGTFYFGTQSSTGAVQDVGNNTSQGNPYWTYPATSSLTQNQWYLVVGHVFPYGFLSPTAHPESGYYTTSGGQVTRNTGSFAGNITDAAWQSTSTTTYHRCYHYYCADSTTRLEFYDPRVDLCDGTEPSITRLLTGPMTNSANGIIFPDGSKRLGGSTGDEGSLISINSYGSTTTWSKPSGCTKVYVKVVGGGGGGCGYCESGGAGGYAEGMFDVTAVSSVTVTIGGGGAGATYYAAATGGGTSSFGSYISATGGGGANSYTSHSSGFGGAGSGGFIQLTGGSGTGHINSAGSWSGAKGGASYFGGSAGFIRNHGHLSASYLGKINNGSPGAGGPGSMSDGTTGGNTGTVGENGYVIVYNYK